jgi:hypothetical protein
MSTTKNTATASAVTADRLRTTIKDMDAMSQEGFGRIEALARITLMALETPDAYRFTEMIAKTLETICGIAQSSMDTVYSNAEEVDCNWIETDEPRRTEARRVARERDAQNAGSTR